MERLLLLIHKATSDILAAVNRAFLLLIKANTDYLIMRLSTV